MFENLTPLLENNKNKLIVFAIALVILDFFVWSRVFSFNFGTNNLNLHFLDVGQGDSELVILPGGAKMLIDGGPPNGKLIESLDKILSPTDRYIDIVMMSHPELDHFGGLIDVLKRYRTGIFLWNGRERESGAFVDLMRAIEENSVRSVVLGEGDKIKYLNSVFNVFSPNNKLLKSKELNDTSIVVELLSNNSKTLFTGDIGAEVEKIIGATYLEDIDILKVPHHGSKFSSSANFLDSLNPEIAVIGVGKNSYGHPTKEVLNRLEKSGATVYRTDKDGNIRVAIDGEKIRIFK